MLLTNAIQTVVTISQNILSNVVSVLRVGSALPVLFADQMEASHAGHSNWPAMSDRDAMLRRKRSDSRRGRCTSAQKQSGLKSASGLCYCGLS